MNFFMVSILSFCDGWRSGGLAEGVDDAEDDVAGLAAVAE
jgi:hypothetical protein